MNRYNESKQLSMKKLKKTCRCILKSFQQEAKKIGAIGLFEDTYEKTSKIYFIGGSSDDLKDAYSIEFCGGQHVDFTGKLKSFKIIKQENIGNKQRRVYAVCFQYSPALLS